VRFSVWLVVAIACAALVIPLPPVAVERVYSGLIYPPLQRALTSFSNLVPVALFDVLILGLPTAWVVLAVRDVVRSGRRLHTAGLWGLRTLAAVAALYLVFLMTWGLNYRRVPLERKLKYDANAVTPDAARDIANLAVSRLNALYAPAHADGDRPAYADAALAVAFARTTRELGAGGTTVPGRPKQTILDLYFRPAAVAGMTDPFFLETLVESNLLAIERPFVVAHEWSHLAGFADEGEANFAGWLTCTRADALSQYSGWLSLFGELMNSVPRADRGAVFAALAGGPRDDLRAIAARLARDVKPRVSAAGWLVYNEYLKANRVEAGTASYAQVVRLVLGTRLGLSGEAASPAR
jgi:hypothetical protein